MPTSIPYDPSLILGNVVHPERVKTIEEIAELQAPINASEAKLNSLITLKRSVDATLREMMEMGVNTDELVK